MLTPQEVDLGVCLIEIGAGNTAVAVYNEGSARHLAVLPVGGNHVTSNIAIGLRTTLGEAESLKLNYGHTLPEVIDHGEKVEVRQVGGDRIQALPRRFLAEIIGPRMQEIFQMAREEVRKSGFDGLLPEDLRWEQTGLSPRRRHLGPARPAHWDERSGRPRSGTFLCGRSGARQVGLAQSRTRTRQRSTAADAGIDLSKNSEVASRFFLENTPATSWSSPWPKQIRRRITSSS